MEKHKCSQCGGEATIGDIRSGMIGFGSHFIEYLEGKKTIFGDSKPKPGVGKNNRVVSYACKNFGYLSNYLERLLK